MLLAEVEAEVVAYVGECSHLADERGHRLVVRNGKAQERTLLTGAGTLNSAYQVMPTLPPPRHTAAPPAGD